VSYTPRLGPRALSKLHGFPVDALGELARVVGRICEDPYDALNSLPVGDDPQRRVGMLSEAGFVELDVDGVAKVVTVIDVIWLG
jgi:hypothetical protein